MIPVFQTIIDQKIGNCFSAAIASLMEIPLESVPNFVKNHGDKYTEAAQEWLRPKGLMLLRIRMPHRIRTGEDIRFVNVPECFCLGSGQSPRGNYGHAVVGKIINGCQFQIVHDPHPSGEGLDGPPWCLEFLVPLDPASLIRGSNGQ